jgi:hypothetical protein
MAVLQNDRNHSHPFFIFVNLKTTHLVLSACGLICSECGFFENQCNGCHTVKGQTFWALEHVTRDA